MSKQKQLSIIIVLSLILAAMSYLAFSRKPSYDHTLQSPQIIYEGDQAYLVAQLRNASSASYSDVNLRVNILGSGRKHVAQARARTAEILPGITWFLKSPLSLGAEGEIGAGPLDCRAAAPFRAGEDLVVDCYQASKSR